MLFLGMMGTDCGILIFSMTTKYRDLSVLVGLGMVTPVVYLLSELGDGVLRNLTGRHLLAEH